MLSRTLLRPLLSFGALAPSGSRARAMHIQSIPMWVGSSNNYAYIVKDDETKDAVIIDPANAEEAFPPLQSAISSSSINLTAIVNTHHHWDHSGGNNEILSKLSSTVPIIGGKKCQSVSRTPENNSTFPLGKNIKVTALYTPCHTEDSICFYMHDTKTNEKVVFTGDTLFHGGCGKFFEGTAAQMHTALNKTLSSLPDDTLVFPGHEYTKSNVKFLLKVAGDNPAVQELDRYANSHKETQGKFTIADEKKHNVFMRVDSPEMQKVTGETEPSAVMARLREMKNNM